ncbi:phosphoenolpyruvate-protein phosphotransferase [Geobacter metallireducens RCH3]|uniref:Phosphoenolpyruvate-protein phosphotransferase n=1 Tax=Geobacter metallireducens (strain ATCC 53774 / DSM 7210 / GS-15) TaxID=269799 RepID=Q39W49_GEOMG|nr:phosphoenolpyruvate--protein phosphotransferase [Geobacter metallireducens]ABB31525.1 phosphoenolpyruvate--protein phosphotransferase [Geobacter metallireducens GS-15]EHP88384.1 phosphoenolpyruvate-protein phosphotransferase [Geobacter metallireducens RCH3]
MDSARNETRIFRGIEASAGIAIGTARLTDRSRVAVTEVSIGDEEVELECARFLAALQDAREELLAVKEHLASSRGPEHLYVVDSHLLILEDGMLTRGTLDLIAGEKINAEAALKRNLLKFKEFFSAIEDEYLRERAGDVETVVERIMRAMVGKRQECIGSIDGGKIVIVAHDLSPTDILQIDKNNVIGFITDLGGRTSHTAILARALEIPAVVGLETITGEDIDGLPIIIDGTDGTVVVNPDQDTFRDYLRRKQRYDYLEQEFLKLRDLPAETIDGHRISLMGNIEFAEEIPTLKGHGGEGIGLYRTEMLYMNRQGLPDEEEQYLAYSAIVEAMAPLPITIRTLDVGGDKLATDLHLEDEMNPALGLRAIRLSLRKPEVFKTQLRAILRASVRGKVRIFFPMISGVEEVRAAKAILEEAKNELRAEGVPFDNAIDVGIMIEIPSAVLVADILAREVDFFSVGTNDLIQYSLAIDRTNEHLAHLYQPMHPAVLRSLRTVVDAAHAAGIRACMCGEVAGESRYLPILLGLGFDELSMTGVSIPRVKKVLRRAVKADAQLLVSRAFTFSTAAEVEAFLNSEISARFSESFD